jgi:hypothetical protein
MTLETLLKAIEANPVATAIRENDTLFPWVECAHVLAITVVIGSIAIVDLRLIGLGFRGRTLSGLTKDVLPVTWAAFALAAITGALLFMSNAVTYAHNFFFLGKMILLGLAGLNMAFFHLLAGRDIGRWGESPHTTPTHARVAGVLSICLWIGIVAFGRWIGFTLHPTPAG